MIFVTGDTHGFYDLDKLDKFLNESSLFFTKEDYVIICGDTGFVWNYHDEDILNHVSDYPWTTLFIDGNHCNFPKLDDCEIVEKFEGEVHKLTESIFHLQRGEIYTIGGKTFWCMGGGYSIDKICRQSGVSWWEEEMPNEWELQSGIDNLEECNNKIDYIITHSCSNKIFDKLCETEELSHKIVREEIELRDYFDIIEKTVKFKKWFFGHFHVDIITDNKHQALYQDIVRIK